MIELIKRYEDWLIRGNPSPYNKNKKEWEEEVKAKIKELKKNIHE